MKVFYAYFSEYSMPARSMFLLAKKAFDSFSASASNFMVSVFCLRFWKSWSIDLVSLWALDPLSKPARYPPVR